MTPFLLPIVLLLYGEFSKGYETRYMSRVLFYTYTLSVIFPTYIPDHPQAIFTAVAMIIFGFGYGVVLASNILGKFFLSIALISSVLNYSSIYLQDYTFLLSVPYYADYSHFIFRESLILGVSCVSIQEKLESKDFRLEMIVAGLMAWEHFVI